MFINVLFFIVFYSVSSNRESFEFFAIFTGSSELFFEENKCLSQLSHATLYIFYDAYKDLNWACGWHLDDDERKDISKWCGKNLLGFALMEVREQIRAEMGEDSGSISI